MTCRMEGHLDASEFERFAVGNSLRAAGEIVAIAQPHHVDGLLRGQHCAVAGARVIGMAVGDQRPLDRPHRVDMKAAGLAAEAGGDEHQDVLRALLRYHLRYIVAPDVRWSLVSPARLSR